MRVGSLFSGIGGLELGLERAGLGPVVWQVEQSEFCRKVLAKHWPEARRYEDVRTVGSNELGSVDAICGGFPCQDISSAGKGAGLAGSRSGLWFEFERIVGLLRPQWVIVENVAGGAKRWVNQVASGLGRQGYDVLPVPLSASDVGAPHLRRRIFLIAHSNGFDIRQQSGRGIGTCRSGSTLAPLDGQEGITAHSNGKGLAQRQDQSHGQEQQAAERGTSEPWDIGPSVSPVCGVDDGIPDRVDRIRALGNAVVPQCAEVIGNMILEMEKR